MRSEDASFVSFSRTAERRFGLCTNAPDHSPSWSMCECVCALACPQAQSLEATRCCVDAKVYVDGAKFWKAELLEWNRRRGSRSFTGGNPGRRVTPGTFDPI